MKKSKSINEWVENATTQNSDNYDKVYAAAQEVASVREQLDVLTKATAKLRKVVDVIVEALEEIESAIEQTDSSLSEVEESKLDKVADEISAVGELLDEVSTLDLESDGES